MRGFLGFAALSGTGWLIDLGLTMGLVRGGMPAFWASIIGAATAVSWVYLASRLSIFGDKKIGTGADFGLYVLWQICAITAASFGVAMLTKLLLPWVEAIMGAQSGFLAAGLAKILITPATLLANYAFMKWLTEHRASKPKTNSPEDGS